MTKHHDHVDRAVRTGFDGHGLDERPQVVGHRALAPLAFAPQLG